MKILPMRSDSLMESVFPVLYAIFFLGFFIFPTSKAISYFFYFGIAFPFLAMVLLKKVRIVPIFSGRVFSITALFLVYIWLTILWADDFSASDLLIYGRRVSYILCFIASTVYLVNRDKDFLRRLLVLFCWVAAGVSVAYPVYFSRAIHSRSFVSQGTGCCAIPSAPPPFMAWHLLPACIWSMKSADRKTGLSTRPLPFLFSCTC